MERLGKGDLQIEGKHSTVNFKNKKFSESVIFYEL